MFYLSSRTIFEKTTMANFLYVAKVLFFCVVLFCRSNYRTTWCLGSLSVIIALNIWYVEQRLLHYDECQCKFKEGKKGIFLGKCNHGEQQRNMWSRFVLSLCLLAKLGHVRQCRRPCTKQNHHHHHLRLHYLHQLIFKKLNWLFL